MQSIFSNTFSSDVLGCNTEYDRPKCASHQGVSGAIFILLKQFSVKHVERRGQRNDSKVVTVIIGFISC